jgi:hypothetical protein
MCFRIYQTLFSLVGTVRSHSYSGHACTVCLIEYGHNERQTFLMILLLRFPSAFALSLNLLTAHRLRLPLLTGLLYIFVMWPTIYFR